jgi:hypothetical protein
LPFLNESSKLSRLISSIFKHQEALIKISPTIKSPCGTRGPICIDIGKEKKGEEKII